MFHCGRACWRDSAPCGSTREAEWWFPAQLQLLLRCAENLNSNFMLFQEAAALFSDSFQRSLSKTENRQQAFYYSGSWSTNVLRCCSPVVRNKTRTINVGAWQNGTFSLFECHFLSFLCLYFICIYFKLTFNLRLFSLLGSIKFCLDRVKGAICKIWF